MKAPAAEPPMSWRTIVTSGQARVLVSSSELSDPTITISSLGEQGVESVFGIIFPPQVAIVGFGKVVERPWAVDGQVIARPLITATLSADHRVSDGHRGGLFLAQGNDPARGARSRRRWIRPPSGPTWPSVTSSTWTPWTC